MSSQLKRSNPFKNHLKNGYDGPLVVSSFDEPEPLLIDVPDCDEAPVATDVAVAAAAAACIASSDEVDSTIGCQISGPSKRFRKDLTAVRAGVNNSDARGPDSRCSEVSSESSLHNNIFEYLSGLATAPSDGATAVTQAVLHVTETYQFAMLTNANTIVIDDGEDQYEASYDIQASVDENGFIDVPVDFAPKLLDQDGGEIYDISDRNFTISSSRDAQQQQQHQREPLPAAVDGLSVWAAEAARADADISQLRRAAFRLVLALLPQLELRPGFDCTTRSTDRLLLALCSILDCSSGTECRLEFDRRIQRKLLRKRSRRLPAVSLCSKPFDCAVSLRRRIVQLLHLLLPDLTLPDCIESVLLSNDERLSPSACSLLSMLIDRIVKHSKRPIKKRR